MFGIGFPELLLIMIIALVVVGPERLPELGRQLGTIVRDLRRVYSNLRSELGPEFDDIERNIRELRSLDPRQQMRDYSRSLLEDLSADAPELKQLSAAGKLDLETLGRGVLHDDLLDKPLAATTGTGSATQNTIMPPAAATNGGASSAVPPSPSVPAATNGGTSSAVPPSPSAPAAAPAQRRTARSYPAAPVAAEPRAIEPPQPQPVIASAPEEQREVETSWHYE